MFFRPLTQEELTVRAKEAAQMYHRVAEVGVRPHSSNSIAHHLEWIAEGNVVYAADYARGRSYLAQDVRAGIASGEIDPDQVVIIGSGIVSEDVPQSKLYAAIEAARALGGSGRYLVGGRADQSRTHGHNWLVLGPVVRR